MKNLRRTWPLVAMLVAVGLTGVTPAEAGPRNGNGGGAGKGKGRILSFNIRFDFESDGAEGNRWAQRVDVVAKTIAGSGAVIACLQEDKEDQVQDLREKLPAFEFVGKGRNGGSSGEHCAIAYKKEDVRVKDSGNFWLSDTPQVEGSNTWGDRYPRKATWILCEVKKSKSPLLVINTHLPEGGGRNADLRSRGVRVIREFIDARIDEKDKDKVAVICTGDFNCGADEEPRAVLAQSQKLPLRDAFIEARPSDPSPGTFNGFRGMKTQERIDWILVGGPVRVGKYDKIDEQVDGRWPSDHYPIFADFELR